MRGQQDRAASTLQRALQVLQSLHADERRLFSLVTPPHERCLHDCAAEGFEVTSDQGAALALGQLGQAQAQVDAGNVPIPPRQRISEPTERTANRHLLAPG